MTNGSPYRVILLEPEAPPKPAQGAPCNGCGVCCLAEPCPLGMLLSGSRSGACKAVRWEPGARHYRCGALVDAAGVLQPLLPRGLQWARAILAFALRRWARRWIAAGMGCDSSLQATPSSTMAQSSTYTPSHASQAHHP